MSNFPDFLKELVEAGIDITISKNDRLGFYFDLNLQAKSHMYLYADGDSWFVDMRYDEVFEVSDADDLKRLARHGMHGRDYVNSAWAEFMMSDEDRARLELARAASNKLSSEELAALREFL